MTAHAVTLTEEGGGWVATCSCRWVAWHTHRDVAESAWRKHLPRGENPALLSGSEHFGTVESETKRGPESLAGNRPSDHLSFANNERG